MKHLSRFLLGISALLLLAFYIPGGYWLVAEKSIQAPSVLYSCVDQSFVFYRFDGEKIRYTDEAGTRYEREDFEPKIPLMTWAQLTKDGRMPAKIGETPLSIEKIRRAQFSARLRPSDIDAPKVRLYPLLESESGRVRLEMPEDYMRLSDRIEFLDPKTGAVIAEKSAIFAQAFRDAGFAFPVQSVGGNPTNRKPYDEGFFLSDAKGTIFRLRQVKGKPELLRLAGDLAKGDLAEQWNSIRARHFLVQESDSRELRVLILDTEGKLHIALGPDYRRFSLPLEHYNPAESELTIKGDLINRVIVSENKRDLEALAYDRSYKLVRKYTEPLPTRDELTAGKLAKHLFPFTFSLQDPNSGFLRIQLNFGSPLAFAINGLLLALGLIWFRWKRHSLKDRAPDLVLIATGGLLGLLVAFALPRSD